MVSVFELDIFLNTNCLNVDLLGLLYTLMLSLNLAASNSFAEELSSLFIGWSIVNSDLGVSHEIILMTWVVLSTKWWCPRYDQNYQLWIAKIFFYWLQLTTTNKESPIKFYTGHSSTFLELEYVLVWNWEPNRVQHICQKLWSRHFINEQSNRHQEMEIHIRPFNEYFARGR